MMQRTPLPYFLILISALTAVGDEGVALRSEMRSWTAAGSQKSIVAELTRVTVELRASGSDKTVRVAADRLSPNDLRFLALRLESAAIDLEVQQTAAATGDGEVAQPLPTETSPKALELVRLLSDARPEIRIGALQQLASLQESSTKIVDATVNSFEKDPSSTVRNEAASTLGRLPDLGDQKRRICRLLHDATITTRDNEYRRIAVTSLVEIDRNGLWVRKVIDNALATSGPHRNENVSWAIKQLSDLHRNGYDVSWSLTDLTELAEVLANGVVSGDKEFERSSDIAVPAPEEGRFGTYTTNFLTGEYVGATSSPHTHQQLIQFLEQTIASNQKFLKHLERYSKRDLPAVSRSNSSAENLLTEYKLILERSR